MHPHLIQIEPDTAAFDRQRQAKVWVRQVLQLPDDVLITASEMRCPDPNCPVRELVILVHDQAPPRTIRVAHPEAALTKAHVLQALNLA